MVRAFTLIELLVVTSIIALLLTIALPSLGAARDAARDLQCRSNQRQIMQGFTSVLSDFDNLTPRTYRVVTGEPKMRDYLDAAFPGIASLHFFEGADPGAFNVCPQIDTRFDRPGYWGFNNGFAVNTRLRADGAPGDNERIPWESLPTPSAYPWLADPQVQPYGVAADFFGAAPAADGGWWLGTYHRGDTRGNAVFADGHGDVFARDDLAETAPSGVPYWLVGGR